MANQGHYRNGTKRRSNFNRNISETWLDEAKASYRFDQSYVTNNIKSAKRPPERLAKGKAWTGKRFDILLHLNDENSASLVEPSTEKDTYQVLYKIVNDRCIPIASHPQTLVELPAFPQGTQIATRNGLITLATTSSTFSSAIKVVSNQSKDKKPPKNEIVIKIEPVPDEFTGVSKIFDPDSDYGMKDVAGKAPCFPPKPLNPAPSPKELQDKPKKKEPKRNLLLEKSRNYFKR